MPLEIWYNLLHLNKTGVKEVKCIVNYFETVFSKERSEIIISFISDFVEPFPFHANVRDLDPSFKVTVAAEIWKYKLHSARSDFAWF